MKEPEEIKLTKKQEMFCRHYIANGYNGTDAAIKAGYSEATARSIASENLMKPYIAEFIKKLENPLISKLGIDENWVLTKLKNFSDVDINDFFEIDKDGNVIKLKDLKELPREKTAAIESIKETRNGIEIKLVDKRLCVVDIGRHLGMFKDVLHADVDEKISVEISYSEQDNKQNA